MDSTDRLIGSEGEAGVPAIVHPHLQIPDHRPIIGLLAQQCKGLKTQYGYQYFAHSYVQWIESGGGRVVPVKVDQDQAYYDQLFQRLNGLLLPGGGQNLLDSGYARAARFFFRSARRSFDDGEKYFPIWGTCLGFEELAVLSQEENMLTRCNGCQNVSLSMRFVDEEDEKEDDVKEDDDEDEKDEDDKDDGKSRLLLGIPEWAKETFRTKEIAPHFHIFCLRKDTFQASPTLRSEFRILSTAMDEDGNEFVDMFESKRYPFYGVQFHPEKNAFEWSPRLSICHDPDAILASQSLILFFISECRRNRSKLFSSSPSSFPSSSNSAEIISTSPPSPSTLPDFPENLIENYTSIDTSGVTVFHRCYFFDK